MELREKVEATLRQWVKPNVFVSEENLAPVAAAILAIPEIRDALAFRESTHALTKAAMGKGRYEKRGDFMVWVRDDGTESAKLTIYP